MLTKSLKRIFETILHCSALFKIVHNIDGGSSSFINIK